MSEAVNLQAATLAMRPLGRRVLIRKVAGKVEKTAGGLFIPEVAQELEQFARVEVVGPEVETVRPGDLVYVWGGAGMRVELNGAELFIAEERELLALVDVMSENGTDAGA
jgi:chaperonin GroES